MARKRETLTLDNVSRSGKPGSIKRGTGYRLVNPGLTRFWKVNVVGTHGYGKERYAVLQIRRTSP